MINEYYAKNFCCEDLSLIENYYKAIADTTQTWECHHRGEILPCGRFSRDDLKKFGLYYKRPASELIFLTPTAHRRLHFKGVPRGPMSEDHKKALSDAKKGVPIGPIGPMSYAHKKAIGKALRGVPKGPMSEEHKKAIGDANSKKVLQFTKSGEFIREWPSAYEAERELGIAQSGICNCCNGKYKSAGGYVWEYA